MGINLDKPYLWKKDIMKSVDLYNAWFMDFAPKVFRETRILTAKRVEKALAETDNCLNISVAVLEKHPEILPILRMSTCPPIARDRLIGLAGVSRSLIQNMENVDEPHISPRMSRDKLEDELRKIINIVQKMADPKWRIRIFLHGCWKAENQKRQK